MTGVSQTHAGFQEALKTCGTMDSKGNTIGMVNVTGTVLRWIPLGIRVAGLILLLLMVRFRQPLGFLPGDMLGIEWLSALQHWELFSTWTWLLAVVLYLVYLAFTIVSKGLYRGVPGQAILFSRYGKVVKTLIPGEFTYIFDPRVIPSGVISTKTLALELSPIEGFTMQGIKMSSRGTILVRVKDTLLLTQQGGFDNFFEQIQGTFAAAQKDLVLRSSAKEFNLYMIEPAHYEKNHLGTEVDIDSRLKEIEQQSLSVDMLLRLSEISELNVSQVRLTESDTCSRKGILAALKADADRFGIEIVDYIPQGNLTDSNYLQTLAFNLVQWIQRLKQASHILKDILQQEIDEEITARVANKQRGLLQITQLCSEIRSLNEALGNKGNQQSIIEATESSMRSKVGGKLAEYLAHIEALTARVQADQINTASLERFTTETEALLASLKDIRLPEIGTIVLSELSAESILPKIDVINSIIENSGIQTQIDGLNEEGQASGDRHQTAQMISDEAAKLDTTGLIKTIQTELGAINLDTGINTARYTPVSIGERIGEIEAQITAAESTSDATAS